MATSEIRVRRTLDAITGAIVLGWRKKAVGAMTEDENLREQESEMVASKVATAMTGARFQTKKHDEIVTNFGDLLPLVTNDDTKNTGHKTSGEAIESKVPTLNESAIQAAIFSWKKSGDTIKAGDVLVELETEPVVMGGVALTSGVLASIYAPEDNIVRPGHVIASMADQGGSSTQRPSRSMTHVQTKEAGIEVKPSQLTDGIEGAVQDWKKVGESEKVGESVATGSGTVEVKSGNTAIELFSPVDGMIEKVGKESGDSINATDAARIVSYTADATSANANSSQADTSNSSVTTRTSDAVADFDVIVIGSGPGGYIAAIRAAQLGMRVACIEKRRSGTGKSKLGGTCLNVGCIPSKALLASSEEYEKAVLHLKDHGVNVESVTLDLQKMLARKAAVVEKITSGVEFLFRKNKVSFFHGHGRLASRIDGMTRVEIEGDGMSQFLIGANIIIATGSKARHLPGVSVDNRIIADNEGALSFDSVPGKLAVIGSGVIGLELGSVWRRLGSQVTLLEALPDFLAAVDVTVAKEAAKQFKAQKLDIRLGVKIGKIDASDKGVSIGYKDKDGEAQLLEVDRLIVSVGRVPNTEDLQLESVGLSANEHGFIDVDDHCATKIPNIFAVGDVVRGPMLAHKAEDEGVMVAESIAGMKPHIEYGLIPWVIYTDPEIAWVGKTEQQLNAEGRKIKPGQFPMTANGRAMGMSRTTGFVKVIADADTDEILGVHIISANASDMIAEAVVAMKFKASSQDIGEICHPHPSLSEAMREAALAVQKRALNM